MALTVTSIDELDTARVTETLEFFKQLMQERHPEVELSRGAFHDLVLYFNSVLNAAVRENIERVRQSNSLLAITQNPALADDTIVDQVLSNYNLSRGAGAAAVGEAVVVVNQAVNTQISSLIQFTANGLTFLPARTYIGVPPGESTAAEGTRSMVPVGDGSYAFKIAVYATTLGISGNITTGTAFVPSIAPSNVKAIYAASDFTDGTDPPTNAEYIARLPEGLAAKTIGGRKSFLALIKSQPEFQNIRHVSVVGFGDSEQKRDQRGLFPISGGGRVDIYVQTNDTSQRVDHLLTANYVRPVTVGDNTAGTVWRIFVNHKTAPGFYAITRVARINDKSSTGYEIVNTVPGYSFRDMNYKPDIASVSESAYTRFKTLTIDFIDTMVQPNTVTTGQTEVYAVTTTGLPLIGELQDFLSGRDVRCRAADVLVRAAIPCFTTIAFKIRRAANDTLPDFAAIKKAVAAAVAKVGFAGQLSASVISSAAHQYLSGQQSVTDIDIFGRLVRPDGRVIFLRDPARIDIPNDPENMISSRTTVFYAAEEDIEIAVDITSGFSD